MVSFRLAAVVIDGFGELPRVFLRLWVRVVVPVQF
ncbi:hypothetical protein A2U01_0095851, partial [Trifolium medium]|nr:hypothetical protein [Trifolium medium]